jgi:undecaprenyl-diphosphatase
MLLSVDNELLHSLNGFFLHHDVVEDSVVAYVNAAELLFLGALLVAFSLVPGAPRRGARRAVVAAGLSAGLALGLAQLLSHAIDRPRPFVADPSGVHVFARHAADPGFPSDHATAAFAIAVAILLRDRRWGAVALAFACVLAAGRVAMGLHYPSDVLGGAVLGAACASALWAAPVRRLLNRLADTAGRLLDGIVAAVVARGGPASRT